MNTSFGFNRNDHQWVEGGRIVAHLVDIVNWRSASRMGLSSPAADRGRNDRIADI